MYKKTFLIIIVFVFIFPGVVFPDIVAKPEMSGSEMTVIYYENGVIIGKEIVDPNTGSVKYTGKTRNGKCKLYDLYGNMIVENTYINGEPFGTAKSYFDNGKISGIAIIKKSSGLLITNFKFFNRKGVLIREGKKVDYKLEGELKIYDENGVLMCVETYENGIMKKRIFYDKNGKPKNSN